MTTAKLFTAILLSTHALSGACLFVSAQGAPLIGVSMLQGAQQMVNRLYKELDIQVLWTTTGSMKKSAGCTVVNVEFEADPSRQLDAHVMAFAAPYRSSGVQIHVFLSRVLRCPSLKQNAELLGYTIAHEIGHVLQRTVRHSDSGVMKPSWTAKDMPFIESGSLGFSQFDALLIEQAFVQSDPIFALSKVVK